MHPLVAVALGYVSGSFPSAYLAGRLVKGIDLRTVGSGNLGTTNVYRNLGPVSALVVFFLDALKGALPVILLTPLISSDLISGANASLWWGLIVGVAAIVGHGKPIFLLWKGGGKGVATAAGVFATLATVPFLIAFSAFILTSVISGYVSLGSIVGAITLPILLAFMAGINSPVFLICTGVAAFVLWSHRGNMSRLKAGTEPRTFGRKKGES